MKQTLVVLSLFAAALTAGFTANAQSNDEEMVAVYRWFNTVDRNYVTIAEGEYQEGQILNWKYNDKTLLFFGYRNPKEGRVAVYSWFNPRTKDVISIAEDEFNDDQMIKMGYTNKHLQFYADSRRGPNTLAVYRWYISKYDDWVTVPEEGNTDAYIKKGYKMKTFQYFAV